MTDADRQMLAEALVGQASKSNQPDAPSSAPQSPTGAELRSYEFPWYKRWPHAVSDWWYGENATAPQQQGVNKLLGTDNPFNLPGQISEGSDRARAGWQAGNYRELLEGLLQLTGGASGVAGRFPVVKGRGYRGSNLNTMSFPNRDDGVWASSNPHVASTYADWTGNHGAPNVMPLEFKFNKPLVVDALGSRFDKVPFGKSRLSTDEISDIARAVGHDGVVYRNILDSQYFGTTASDVYHALKRGTTRNAITGELLYGMGGVGLATPWILPPEMWPRDEVGSP